MTEHYGPAGEQPATPPTLPYGIPEQPTHQTTGPSAAAEPPATSGAGAYPPPADPTYGQATSAATSAYGQTADPVHGQPAPAPPSAYGSPAYGQAMPPAQDPFVQTTPDVYGQGAPEAYGQTPSPLPNTLVEFGQAAYPQPSPGAGAYGQPAPAPAAYGQPASAPAAYAPPAQGYAPPVSATPSDPFGPVSGAAGGAIMPYGGAPAVQPYTPPPVGPGFGAPVPPSYANPAYGYAQGANPYGVQHNLVSLGGRFGGLLLEVLLCVVTLGVGYLIWSLIAWGAGQTPGKQLLGHVVVDRQTGVPFGWGRMCMRQFVVQGLLGGLLNAVSCNIFGIVDACVIFGGTECETLHDKFSGSAVVYRTA